MSGLNHIDANSPIPLEGDYLRELLASFLGGEQAPLLPALFNWDRFDGIARTQAVVAICRRLMPVEAIPDTIREEWDSICTEHYLDNSMALKGARKILSALKADNIPAAVLRGLRMAYSVYPDPVLRPMRDVDILIPPEARDAARASLARAGINPEKIYRSQLLYRIHRKDYELHWSFLTPRRYRKAASYHHWLQEIEDISTPQGKLQVLNAENELLGLITHSFIHHELDRISQAIDIALVMETGGLDWAYIRDWTEEARLTKMICFVLGYVQWLFSLPSGDWSPWVQSNLEPGHEDLFIAYEVLSLGTDRRPYYMARRKHLLQVAETLPLKARQILRFINLKEARLLFGSVFGEASRSGAGH